jgi:hypothetical protein
LTAGVAKVVDLENFWHFAQTIVHVFGEEEVGKLRRLEVRLLKL